jgi:small GTP-binding protein
MMKELNQTQEQNNSNSPKKILIMGLDNAGKTSIVLSLKGHKNLLTFYSLNPTKGINIVNVEALDSRFNIWDFGGQKVYRSKYMEDFGNYIKGIGKIIYVLDVQNEERYETALGYLAQIVEKLKKHNLNVDFSIFLHKYDPGIKFNTSKIQRLVKNINKKMDDAPFPYEIYKTTIYTTFSKTPIFID